MENKSLVDLCLKDKFRELKTEREDLRDDSAFYRPLWNGFVSPTLCMQIKEKESALSGS